ncbi:MAG: GGDEF domain-containing protein [Solirubrobacterales bacterium]|nr:GGDEF domain-containing protein [Solirubrobacterales bacterium]
MSAPATTWLCPNPGDRERLVDMDRRLKPQRARAMGCLAVALIVAAVLGRVGWWSLLPLGVAAGGFAVVEHNMARLARPEYGVAVAWLLAQVSIAASVALTGAVDSPAIAWLVLPVATLPARFTTRGVNAGVAATAGLMLLATAAVEPSAALERPEYVLFALALLAATAVLSIALMRSDIEHREEAVIDPLTGMLNRAALRDRTRELAAQAGINERPVGVVVLDLDHFKQVNDDHGHGVGDAVLRDVAYRIRKELRAYDLAYRLGGEEFLVLLPGADVEVAVEIAETLRVAIEQNTGSLPACSASFGVSASVPGRFDYEAVFELADRALYAAKAAGRNTVRASTQGAAAGMAAVN